MAPHYVSSHQQRIQKILNCGKKDSARKQHFIAAFFAPITLEVLQQFSAERAYELASHVFDAAAKRRSGQPAIHVREESLLIDGIKKRRCRLVIINDDMPFLVDSIGAALQRLHLKTHIMLHPIVRVSRSKAHMLESVGGTSASAESVVYVELSALPKNISTAAITAALEEVLKHVRACVEDWPAMERAAGSVIDELSAGKKTPALKEDLDFIAWLRNRNFVFLGHARFDGTGKTLKKHASSALGIYRLESTPHSAIEHQPSAVGSDSVVIAKASHLTHVHRSVHMDLVVIKHRDAKGVVTGETRFLGLFTSNVYYQSAMDIPIIRRKISRALERTGYQSASHSGKALRTIFEFLPRDELFLMNDEELFAIGMGVLSAEAYPKVQLFLRHDVYKRHVAALVYIPRERFTTSLREEIIDLLCTHIGGTLSTFYTQISDSPLARMHVMIETPGGAKHLALEALESTIAALVNNWEDGLRDALVRAFGEDACEALASRYADGFSNSYIHNHDAATAAHDIRKIEACLSGDGTELELFRLKGDAQNVLHVKCFTRNLDAALSDIFPLLENMGLTVRDVVPYTITPVGTPPVLLRDFTLNIRAANAPDIAAHKARLEEALGRIWRSEAANDSMNALLFLTAMSWRDVQVLRAYVRYLQQIGFPYRLGYMSQVLATHHDVASLLSDYFHAKFDPARKKREAEMARLSAAITARCEQISNLAEDRILRRIFALMQATLRTNFYQLDAHALPKPYLSFKFASGQIPEMPLPVPYAEIFVTSQKVEGIHLRGDKVARGGLRWSDRAEDFRTEILGLVKAQMVKNAVIVPQGAKGGFVLRQPPSERDALQAEGISCYREFLCGLLDITDNIVQGNIVPPRNVVRHDGDDPYLVVAADKGTASFSDIANGVAADYGFWLGDAFASGGSVGYDHKAMAITARGAWVAVERHFREMGRDVNAEPFTAVGIGDMSGDVFGNGLLLADSYKLLAAFNHKHIFLDPTPDPKQSFAERKRLFALPRSQWSDYDAKKISRGGGVFERSAKEILLSKEVRDALSITATKLSPDELIQAILKAPVDLLWNGGIGTYVKASHETHDQVGDRSNNAVRVGGGELRCKVVGEGGNLGFTQAGRIEYARTGGRLNTDAIDNSAGVDCSDHEVNIKIALGASMAKKKLTLAQRNSLLKAMTDDVARLVLVDNTLQTQALSIAQHQGSTLIEPAQQLMHALEADGFLNRRVETLPDDKQLDDMRKQGQGFTRPELAVLLAYSKMSLYRDLKEEKALDDAYFNADLARYFPSALTPKFDAELRAHPLRREIIATMMTNSIINRTGITLAHELVRETGLKPVHIGLAYVAVRDMFGLRAQWKAIESLSGKVDAAMQMRLFTRMNQFIAHQMRWLLAHHAESLRIGEVTSRYQKDLAAFAEDIDTLMSQSLRLQCKKLCDEYSHAGVPKALAATISRMEAMSSSLDILETAYSTKRNIRDVAQAYFELGSLLRLGWLRQLVRNIPAETYWQRQAGTALKSELYQAQRRITLEVLRAGAKKKPAEAVASWQASREGLLARYGRFAQELESLSRPDFATLTVAMRQVQAITG